MKTLILTGMIALGAFVVSSAAAQSEADQMPLVDDAVEATGTWTEAYPLGTCPVSGQKLGSMGGPIIKVYDGREVRLCCAGCIDAFEGDTAAYWKQINEQIISDQINFYPTDVCIVSGESLIDQGEDVGINLVYGNRLVRLCCTMCERKFKKSPEEFIAKLNAVAADGQRESYPLTTCMVSGGELGSMGDPFEMVVGGRLMRFCCGGCEPALKADPARFIAHIDEARSAQEKGDTAE